MALSEKQVVLSELFVPLFVQGILDYVAKSNASGFFRSSNTEACNFWHPKHRVLKDEREPLTWPVPGKVGEEGSDPRSSDEIIGNWKLRYIYIYHVEFTNRYELLRLSIKFVCLWVY